MPDILSLRLLTPYTPGMKTVASLLIVDDNPGDIELCRVAFGSSGRFPYIFAARDGEEALALFLNYEGSRETHPERFPPILMLLDINMPRMDGFGFLEKYSELREKLIAQGTEPSIVVMITSSTDPRDQERAKASGFVSEFMHKPPTEADAIRLAEQYGSVV